MRNLKDVIIESIMDDDEETFNDKTVKTYTKKEVIDGIIKWFTLDNIPKPDERFIIKLDNKWDLIVSHVVFSNTSDKIIEMYFRYKEGDDKYRYSYRPIRKRYQKDDNFKLSVYELIKGHIKTFNSWCWEYLKDTSNGMDKDIPYQDKEFSKIIRLNINDIM